MLTSDLALVITKLIRQYLSPEQVSGYLKQHHAINLSHETIYRFIYNDANRVCITERQKAAEKKEGLGDWECDTVIGQDRKRVLVTVVDRAPAPIVREFLADPLTW